jgi:aspartyl-tRNA(Asn)/glutamyl-tRNA(Gln) amidotransferase subunit C
MPVDAKTVRYISRLARVAVTEDQVEPMERELNTILGWVEQLAEVDTKGVPPMTSVIEARLKMREDEVTDGFYPERVTGNAPDEADGFFTVPKVVE